MDLVEVNGKPFSKRGKLPGRKQVYRCKMLHDIITPFDKKIESCPICGEPVTPLLTPLIKNGEIVRDLPKPVEIREKVLQRLKKLSEVKEFPREPVLLVP